MSVTGWKISGGICLEALLQEHFDNMCGEMTVLVLGRTWRTKEFV